MIELKSLTVLSVKNNFCICHLIWILHHLMAFFSTTTWVSRHQKGRTVLSFNEARDDGVAVASAGPYANHLHLAPDR